MSVIPLRPASLGALLDEIDRYQINDAEAMRLVDRWFPEYLTADPLEPARQAQQRRDADGHRASDLRVCANPACVRCGADTEQMIRRAAAIPQQRPRTAGEGEP